MESTTTNGVKGLAEWVYAVGRTYREEKYYPSTFTLNSLHRPLDAFRSPTRNHVSPRISTRDRMEHKMDAFAHLLQSLLNWLKSAWHVLFSDEHDASIPQDARYL